MIRGRCPICGRSFEVAALADLPSFPFCSERCRLIDLGRWIDGAYAIPEHGPGPAPETPSPAEDAEEDESS
jgi:endogenous inhibitor of DNA gyrase (YacG/DUF329 family)